MKKLLNRGPTLNTRTVLEIVRKYSLDSAGVEVTSLGGLKKIGGQNCVLITLPNGDQLLIDCGKIVGDDNFEKEKASLYPNFDAINFDRLVAVVLSHGHYDHILAIPKLLELRGEREIPLLILATPVTFVVLEKVLANAGYKADQLSKLTTFQLLNDQQSIGRFKIEAYPVIHSIPGSVCLVIEACKKRIMYLSDFKWMRNNWIEYSEAQVLFEKLARTNIDLLLMDSTNAKMEGQTPSVTRTRATFERILTAEKYKDRRIIIAMFSSAFEDASDIAIAANELGGRQCSCRGVAMSFFFDLFGVLGDQSHYADGQEVIFVTGGQAEKTAVLNKASLGQSDWLELQPSDVVIIASNPIPGNDVNIELMVSRIKTIGCEVITTKESPEIHVSGHEMIDGLKRATETIQPQRLMPIHGDRPSRVQLGKAVHSTNPELDVLIVSDNEPIVI